MKNRTRKKAVFRTMLLAAVGISAVGVVQTSIEPRAEAEPVSVGTISAQMRDNTNTRTNINSLGLLVEESLVPHTLPPRALRHTVPVNTARFGC